MSEIQKIQMLKNEESMEEFHPDVSALPPKIKRRKDQGGKVFFYTMVALPILQFVIFYIIVNFNSILLAFKEYFPQENGVYAEKWVGLDNFRRIFHDFQTNEWMKNLIPNSLLYFGVSLLIVMPLTLLFSYYIYKKFYFYQFFRVMLFLPSIICSLVIILFYRDFVDSVVLLFIGKGSSTKIDSLWAEAYARMPLVIYFVLVGFSSAILLYLNAMSGVSESTVEAAGIDGASELQTFWFVILPSIWGTIVSLFVIALAAIGTEQANLYSIYGNNAPEKLQTLGYYIFEMVTTSSGGEDPTMYPTASAYGLMITLVIAPITIISRNLLLKYGPSED